MGKVQMEAWRVSSNNVPQEELIEERSECEGK